MHQAAPDGPHLLALERHCSASGSGLTGGDLIGCWWLQEIWPKGQTTPDRLSGACLRGLGAHLRIAPTDHSSGFVLLNAVRLGMLELRFEGQALLSGKRPLLRFWFDRLQLRLAGTVLLERPLGKPEDNRLPFFALIAGERGPTGPGQAQQGWLAARGRGGGLALWRLGEPGD